MNLIEPEGLVEGLCCGCNHGDFAGPRCMDYNENHNCPNKRKDGSCWTPMLVEDD